MRIDPHLRNQILPAPTILDLATKQFNWNRAYLSALKLYKQNHATAVIRTGRTRFPISTRCQFCKTKLEPVQGVVPHIYVSVDEVVEKYDGTAIMPVCWNQDLCEATIQALEWQKAVKT